MNNNNAAQEQEHHAEITFGEAALALDIGLELMTTVLAQKVEGFATAFVYELDTLLAARPPTPGARSAVLRLRNHVTAFGTV